MNPSIPDIIFLLFSFGQAKALGVSHCTAPPSWDCGQGDPHRVHLLDGALSGGLLAPLELGPCFCEAPQCKGRWGAVGCGRWRGAVWVGVEVPVGEDRSLPGGAHVPAGRLASWADVGWTCAGFPPGQRGGGCLTLPWVLTVCRSCCPPPPRPLGLPAGQTSGGGKSRL